MYDSCEPPVTPCETSIIGASGWRLWLKGGVKSMPRVPPSGRRMYCLRGYEKKVGQEFDKTPPFVFYVVLFGKVADC